MATATIPVDLRNPGQVFACLGFMEAAEVLIGPAEGGFAWEGRETQVTFTLSVEGPDDPVRTALLFLSEAKANEVAPEGLGAVASTIGAALQCGVGDDTAHLGRVFPSPKPENMALPVCLNDGNGCQLFLSHWADGSSRDTFKLYAGNRSALKVVKDMQLLIRRLLGADAALGSDPLGAKMAMGGSFSFDSEGTWNARDAGYSPDRLGHFVSSSPVVQVFAAIGLENTRPLRLSAFEYIYYAWGEALPPMLARAALASPLPA